MTLENKFDQSYWDKRYREQETGWDIGYPSTPLKEYFDQLKDKDLKILIPGAGNAYEAEYLWKQDFKNVYVLDFSPMALQQFKERLPDFPEEHLINKNFFEYKGQYDLIVEQTFFCALDPSFRQRYVEHMASLLRPGGKLAGLLFDDPLNTDHPPFGGSKAEYEPLFSEYFEPETFEKATNSIPPRAGRELFFIFRKK